MSRKAGAVMVHECSLGFSEVVEPDAKLPYEERRQKFFHDLGKAVYYCYEYAALTGLTDPTRLCLHILPIASTPKLIDKEREVALRRQMATQLNHLVRAAESGRDWPIYGIFTGADGEVDQESEPDA